MVGKGGQYNETVGHSQKSAVEREATYQRNARQEVKSIAQQLSLENRHADRIYAYLCLVGSSSTTSSCALLAIPPPASLCSHPLP